ncbi:PAS domain S-box protein [Geothrix sp. PMB-07]|uniref:PAS domain S-box protein n=1 Tax=Geothrix sp. PMB-07 TaxID=3068640 RepID=UPI002741E1CF|nr:PAS domain S-box protein [Geothrix sp. PMB-07]WLT30405.1 PAS domain S-box protein [Geothrix sp. PMB-07]
MVALAGARPAWPSRPLWSPWPWLGLAVGLLFTLVVWRTVLRAEHARLKDLRTTQANEMAMHLEKRMAGLGQVLRSAAGFLGRGPLPSRTEWRDFVASLALPDTYPGAQGLSFVEWIPTSELPSHRARVRQEGFPDYELLPGGPLAMDPEGCSAILYIEPMDALNQRAFGRDMLREAVRREAMLRARDQGLVTLSGPVTLYQETGADPQVGAVLFAPVYRQGLRPETVVERRRALRGWVSFPLRMGDFVSAALARDLRTAHLILSDGPANLPAGLLFDSDPGRARSFLGPVLIRSFPASGRAWTATVQANAAFYAEAGRHHHWEILVGGLAGSLLIFTLMVTIQGAELRARRLADEREAELLATEARFTALFEHAPFGMAIVESGSGRFLSVNPRMGRILGYEPEELLTRTFMQVTHPDHQAEDRASVEQLLGGETDEIHREKRYLRRDGQVVWGQLSMVRLPGLPGRPARHLSIVEDITEWAASQEALRASEARFRALFDLLPVGVTVTDSHGHILATNPVSEALLGIPSDDMVRRDFKGPYWEVIRPDGTAMPPEEYASVRALAEQRRIEDVEMGVRRPDGSVAWILVTADPIAAQAQGMGLVIVYRDISERRHAEQRLLESEARWQFALDGAGDGVWDWNGDANAMFLSPGYKTMLGYGEAEDIGDSFSAWVERIHPEDREAVLASVEAYLEGTLQVYQMEYRIRRKDGQWTWVLARGTAVARDARGRASRMIGTHTDITARKEAESALQQSESRLRILVDHLPDSFLFQLAALPDGTPAFAYLSGGLEQITGLKQAEALADPALLFSQIDPAMRQAYLEAEAISARDLTPFVMEFRILRPDGAWRWLRVRSAPRRQADGTLIWEGISTDITDQKLGQLLVEESERQFRSVVENAGDAIYLHDGEGAILLCNREACRSTGYPMEALLRMRVSDLDATFMEERNVLARKALEVGQQVSLMATHRRKDGSFFPVEIRLGLLRAEPPRQILAVVRDLSEREQLHESEVRTRKAESLVLMAGSIAHDFNNLFQGVLGYLEVAQARSAGNPALRPALDGAEEALHKAIGLSWKMLDFSGRGLLDLRRVDLESWLPALLATLQLESPSPFQLDLACDPVPLIQGDPAKLEQVVRAVVDNAREAAEGRRGRVRLRLRTDFGQDRPGADSSGFWPLGRPEGPATVCLEIVDDGPGVPREALPLICDPFYTTKELGRGLGLAAAVGILRAHRAGLHLYGGDGKGLGLRIHFPPSGA